MPRHTDYLLRELLSDLARGRISRRHALQAIGGMIGAVAAGGLVASCASGPRAAGPAAIDADRVSAGDPAVVAGPVQFPGDGSATLLGHMARPAREERSPVVLVCHAIAGLTPHIADVTRRLAKAGYLAVAVDLVSREGGTARHTPAEVAAILGRGPDGQAVADFARTLAYARAQAGADPQRAGMIGFCLGGGITWEVAVEEPSLAAVVPFYGSPAAPEEMSRIQAAVLAIYAGNDEIIPPQKLVPPTEAGMRAAGKQFRSVVYPDVDHAFYDDTGDSFSAHAARAAWAEALAWLGAHLGSAAG